MGLIKVDLPGNDNIKISDDGWVRFGIGNFDKDEFKAYATLAGDANHPVEASVTANIGGTDTPVKLAPISANLNGNIDINANIGGNSSPIHLAPVRLELGHLNIHPNIEIEFRLFGILISSIRISGSADVN